MDLVPPGLVVARYFATEQAEVGDKWMASVEGAIGQVMERLTGGLVDRARVLEGRYAKPLPQLERRVEDYGAKVGRGIADSHCGIPRAHGDSTDGVCRFS